MQVSAVIFDLFETLIDFSFDEYCFVLAEIAGLVGAEAQTFVARWDEEWPRCEAGEFVSVADYVVCIASLCGVDAPADGVAHAAAAHSAFQRAVLAPRPGAIETLESLKRQGIATGLVTNCPIETPAYWPTSPLAAFVDVAVFSTIEKMRKPEPELLLRCTRRLQVTPARCVFIGDGANDELNSASGLGMTAVLLNNGHDVSRRRLGNWSGHTVNRLPDLLGLLQAVSTQ